tara:strand:+ start:106 stop:381 length:276 start_codon:yes stop_codon:yes gene_type:complete
MKKILFLILCLMSFSARADMQLLWEQELPNTPNKTSVQAYCVFAQNTRLVGSVFIYTTSVRAREKTLISVEQLLEAGGLSAGSPVPCARKD